MKIVELSDIYPGTAADSSYYSENGELLISKGITITERHIHLLKRRNINKLYVKTDDTNDEIEQIVSKQFTKPNDLQIEETRETFISRKPKVLEVTYGAPGKDGLETLKQSSITIDLDNKIREGLTPDRPIGPALNKNATQLSVKERTEKYKEQVTFLYKDALNQTRHILDSLADGDTIDGAQIRNIVKEFVRIFSTDRNILLNISGVKHTDDYIYNHSLNVCLLSINIAASAEYSEKQIIEIGTGALLHDVGMLLIPKRIRFLKEKLTTEDWYEVQKHPILGLHVLEKIKHLPESASFIAYQVHEREDGRGYPKQRHSRLIHRFAKIVQVADVFEAMSSPRSHRKAYIPYDAMTRLIKMVQQSLIPSDFTSALLAYASLFPVGSLVELNDHRVAKVIHANNELAKPVVSILTDSKGAILKKDRIYQENLQNNTALQIIKALHSDYIKGIQIMDGF